MITPELIGYIRGEFAKGKTREEVHKELIASGGWTEDDISEAFRTVIPMQGFPQSSFTAQGPSKVKAKLSWKKYLAFVVVIILCVVAWYFYRSQIVNFWDSGVNNLQALYNSSLNFISSNFKKITGTAQTQNPTPIPAPIQTPITPIVENTPITTASVVQDCGTTTSPNLKNTSTYQNNTVLSCLGASALTCVTNATAVLKDPLFPTIFEINNDQGACNFKLSYPLDSTLVDVTGNRLAGQYIQCPVSIVKSLDETKTTPIFNAPSFTNASKYASQIYFYGTLGLFIENNVDQGRIQALGCSGPYLNTVIASYQKMQSKQ